MATNNKDRPNLKICIDNSEPSSDVEAASSGEDEVVIHTHFDDDSSMDEERERGSDSEERARREAVIRVTASSFKAKGKARLLSSTSPFKQSSKHSSSKKSVTSPKIEYKVTKEPTESTKPKEKVADVVEIDKADLEELYDSLGLLQDKEIKTSNILLNTINLKGIDGMSSNDVLKYFRGYDPESVDKLNHSSCNVIFVEESLAAKAILEMSKKPEPITKKKPDKERLKKSSHKKDIKVNEEKEEGEKSDDDELNLVSDEEDEKKSDKSSKSNGTSSEKTKDLKTKPDAEEEEMEDEPEEGEISDDEESEMDSANGMSPGKWRVGKPGPDDQTIYMCFATKSEERTRLRIEDRLGGIGHANIATIRKRKHSDARMDYEEGEASDSSQSGDEMRQVTSQVPLSRDGRSRNSRIPDETIFDMHTRDAQSQRLKQYSIKQRLRPPSDDEDDRQSSDGDAIVDIDALIAPPKPKRTMRMHADDEEEQVRAKRLKLQTAGVLKRNAPRSSPPRDIRSRLQLGRRQPVNSYSDSYDDRYDDDRYSDRYDDAREWDEGPAWQPRPQFRDISSSDDRRKEPRNAGPPSREDLWRGDRREAFTLDPRAPEQERNGVWNRNPDWDQDRYKDLDAPQEEDDIFSVVTPVEEFGVMADDIQQRIKAEAMKHKKATKPQEVGKELETESEKRSEEKDMEEDDDYFDLNADEDDEEEEKDLRHRKDWKLKSESKGTDTDLRSKLKPRDSERW